MAKPVFWSHLAEIDFDNILEYLHKNWDSKVVNQFIDLTEGVLQRIARNPRQFPYIHKKLKIRKCVLTNHNAIYYRDMKLRIEVLRIYDTRHDPDRLTF